MSSLSRWGGQEGMEVATCVYAYLSLRITGGWQGILLWPCLLPGSGLGQGIWRVCGPNSGKGRHGGAMTEAQICSF